MPKWPAPRLIEWGHADLVDLLVVFLYSGHGTASLLPYGPPYSVPQHDPVRLVGSRLAIDATKKHEYPAVSLPPKEHLDLVAARWKEYGIED